MRRIIPLLTALALGTGSLLAANPAAAEFRLEKHLALAPGGELVIDTSGGGVTVTGGAVDGATIVVTSDRDREDVESRYTFDFRAEPGRVVVVNRRKGSLWGHWFDWGRGYSLHFEVQVPRATRVELDSSGGGLHISRLDGDARLRSSGGGLHVEDLVGALDAGTSGGGVEVRRVRGNVRLQSSGGRVEVGEVIGDVSARSSGGGVDVAAVTGDVEASSSGGGVHVDGVGGRVSAESSGGPVTAVFAPGAGAGGSLSSSGGGVRVQLAPDARVSIDASSSGGSVVCDLPLLVQGKISRSSLRGDLNGGGPALLLRSSGGGIRIGSTGG